MFSFFESFITREKGPKIILLPVFTVSIGQTKQEQHSFPIFDADWGADEELLLIEGADNFGIGNWQDIADHVGSKTREECEAHYLQVYVSSENWPMPVSLCV